MPCCLSCSVPLVSGCSYTPEGLEVLKGKSKTVRPLCWL